MVTSVKTLKKYLPIIKITFRFFYSNRPLEGAINKIKLIKLIADVYRNFQNYKYRILLSFKDKQISSGNQLASVKRVSYSFKSFKIIRIRIFLINDLKKMAVH